MFQTRPTARYSCAAELKDLGPALSLSLRHGIRKAEHVY